MKLILSSYYLKYKKQILPTVLIVLSFFIFLRIILPQLSSVSVSSKILSEKTDEINTLKETLKIVSALNTDEAGENLSTVMRSLPREKDIGIIFSALTSAAAKSQVVLKDFTLSIGGLYGRAIKDSKVSGVPLVSVTARMSSNDTKSLVAFISSLQTTLPLSQVKDVDIGSSQGTFKIEFYYKPIDLSLIANQDKISPLPQSDLNLINQLREWGRN